MPMSPKEWFLVNGRTTHRRARRASGASILRTLVGLALAAAAVAAPAAHAVTQTIPGSAPNMTIHIADAGNLQGLLPGQRNGMFFPPQSTVGSSYFYVRVKGGPHANTTFSNRTSGFTPVSNGPVTGNFTPMSPAQNITVYDVGPVGGPTLARVTQTTLYVGFQKRFNVIYEVQNTSTAPLQFIAGTAADLYIDGDDSGTGVFIDGPNRFVGGTNAASRKVGGLQEVTLSRKPGETPDVPVPAWASYGEGNWSVMIDRLLSADAFPNTIVTNQIDNGVGVTWNDHEAAPDALPIGATARYEVQWVAQQPVPLTASPAQASRELPGRHEVVLTLIDANRNPVPNLPIRWRIDGVNAFPSNPSDHVRAVTDQGGQVVVTIDGTTAGLDTVLAFADVLGVENGIRESAEPQTSATVRWLGNNMIDGPPTAPPTLTGPNGQITVGTIANPDNAEAATYTFGLGAAASAGFEQCTFDERIGRRLDFPVSVTLEPGGGTIGSAELLIVDPGAHDPNDESGPSAPPAIPATTSNGNVRGFVVECVTNADLWVRFTITEGADTQTFVIPIGGLLLIDPQGIVHDRIVYDQQIAAGASPEQARAAAAISGATVRLQRRNSAGAFVNVLSGDPGIRPNVNPQTTAANGLYQWDVAEGTYRVVVTASGYHTHESRVVEIPPPVLDLHIPLERVAGAVTPPPAGPNLNPPRQASPTPRRAFSLRLPRSRTTRVKLSRGGVLRFGSIGCPRSATACHRPKVTLRAVVRGRGRSRLPAVLATRTFTLRPGQTRPIELRLSRRVAALVRARRSVTVRATVSGGTARARTATFRLVRG